MRWSVEPCTPSTPDGQPSFGREELSWVSDLLGCTREETKGVNDFFIAGDALHLMPPFIGQGLNSGFRDAGALAWRLPMLLQGEWSSAALLKSYQTERLEHVRKLTVGLCAHLIRTVKIAVIADTTLCLRNTASPWAKLSVSWILENQPRCMISSGQIVRTLHVQSALQPFDRLSQHQPGATIPLLGSRASLLHRKKQVICRGRDP